MISDIIKFTCGFSLIDYLLTKNKINGTYYFNHFLGNSYIVYHSMPELLYCYNNITMAGLLNNNKNIINMVLSIHIYHILYYNNKLRFDDWLHHIVMLGFSLPLSLQYNSGAILSHSLFFLSGLPGGIDYLLLFLSRNNIISKINKKIINYNLNLWVRCPGCTLSSYFIFKHLINTSSLNIYNIINFSLVAGSVFWNGIYFMESVSIDYVKHVLPIIEKN